MIVKCNSYLIVSIHASVKDATERHTQGYQYRTVSIHASVKDATITFRRRGISEICFNPRICKRCDLNPREGQYLAAEFQSTHL